jgi:hypothetical protein
MINTYGLKNNTGVDYYHVYQEVQSAKQAARLNMKVELATHEREKHQESVQQTQSSSKPGVGSNLDVTV